ncbi:MAG: toprim domain-containing protein, partial [candidate division Zixibacteria bacterium]|nr:toprim domain-containing protein [candidate division Zixibacteria bacterium]
IRKYLNGRGISDESIDRFKLGYADDASIGSLEGQGIPRERLKDAGLLRKNGSPFFRRVITIPYFEGNTVSLIRARTDPETQRKTYFPLLGYDVQLYNRNALTRSANIVLTEGELDCIVAEQHGFSAIGVPGANAFKEEWKSLFDNLDIVFVCFDADEAGRGSASRICPVLGEKARIIQLPDGQDLSDFFNSGKSADDLRQLLDDGRSFMDLEIARIEALPMNQQRPQLRKLFPYLATLDSVDRKVYRGRFKKNFNFPGAAFNEAIKEAKRRITAKMPHTGAGMDAGKEEPTPEEVAAATELLKSPDLIREFVGASEKLGCVGEDNNKVIVYFALTSRLLDDPISLIVKGESSCGKSFLVETVSRFLPDEELLMFTAMTPKALYHRKDSLAHKGLIIFERAGAEESDYSIRTMQSEKKIIFSTSVKNPETQEYETKDIEIEGPIAYIETTTKPHLHPENETRCFELFIDESETQTERIFHAQQQKFLMVPTEKVDLRLWQVAQKLLKPYRIKIPFVDLINFPTRPIRVRRDYPRFLTMVEASCLLHQHQRRKIRVNREEVLVADIEDYAIAYELACGVLQQTIKAISPGCEELMATIQKHLRARAGESEQDEADQTFTRSDVQPDTGWNRNKISKHLKEAVQADLLEIVKCERGKPTRYRFVKLPDVDTNVLISPIELQEKWAEDSEPAHLSQPAQSGSGQVNSLSDNTVTQPALVAEEI